MPNEDNWSLYPDIHAAGGLGPALAAEFAHLGVPMDVHGFGAGSWARVANDRWSCELSLALSSRLIVSSFWADGVYMGGAKSADVPAIAKSVFAWMTQGARVADMETHYPFFEVDGQAHEFEAGRGVDYTWARLDHWVAQDLPRLIPLIEAAKRRPELRQLLPFTSHESLHFSRCTGYPYTDDVAHAVPLGNGQYQALGPGYRVVKRTHRVVATGEDYHYEEADYDVLGEGDAKHVIGLIVAALPPDCGPAVKGTADDLAQKGKDVP